MATGPVTLISDVVVPSVFTEYTQQVTEEKSNLIQSGALVLDQELSNLLAGGGKTFDVPSFKDLDNDDDNVSTDTAADTYTGGSADSAPLKTGTSQEVGVRLSRNQSWSSSDLTSALAGADPMRSIGDRVGYYWSRRLQAATVATIKGILADNDAAPSGSEHTQYDLTNDVKGASYTAGVTDFTTEAFIDAAVTMGDSMEALGILMVHSVVYSRMQKNNLIDFIPDSNGVVNIPTFLGRQVVVDDGLPVSSGVYDSWIFGAGALRLGVGTPKVPTETKREPDAGNGGGQEVLFNRVEWMIHPVGHKYAGTAANGGPSNAATTNNLAHAGSWERVYPERKQIKIARLITRES
jgi:hypothetical protein